MLIPITKALQIYGYVTIAALSPMNMKEVAAVANTCHGPVQVITTEFDKIIEVRCDGKIFNNSIIPHE